MKALLIDDERLARGELRRLLADAPQIEVVGEASNADEAREQLKKLKPDLLFGSVGDFGTAGAVGYFYDCLRRVCGEGV